MKEIKIEKNPNNELDVERDRCSCFWKIVGIALSLVLPDGDGGSGGGSDNSGG